jgi:hypothetical protein
MSATLRSNCGNSGLTIDLVAAASNAHDAGFEASIAIRVQHWDGDHARPTSLSVEGLWIRSGDLFGLLDHVRAWTDRTLDQLDPKSLDGSFEMARLPGQRFSIAFGARSDTIALLNPVVSVSLAASAFSCEFHFVTDQSCLTIFSSELGESLHES